MVTLSNGVYADRFMQPNNQPGGKMKKIMMNREQAIALCGLRAVDAVEAISCEPTNRVGYNGSCQGDDEVEFSASVKIDDDGDGTYPDNLPVGGCALVAYYYQLADEVDECDGDLGTLNWRVAGYEVV